MAGGKFKGIIAASLLLTKIMIASPIDIYTAGYYIPTSYSDPIKTNTTVIGGYGYFGVDSQTLEVGYDNVLGTESQESVQQNFLLMYGFGLPSIHRHLVRAHPALCESRSSLRRILRTAYRDE